ncbi:MULTISPECIES: DUF3325 domain-containing protein [unclassified Caballeronia]|uniref:DUF3325 domain-containing protein n=1 Tax=unclassified Caballeronia TaxID=2646786 RepID=UPI0028558EE0|nr:MULTISPECIES: DUF3325 domain-containing protein [unclassified Caballeronia]MDR5741518.1 DUF3325 domain-containing protein [Caballeronia sp. LZ016]MDR5806830.1 DUF3325 domain-containing protein [Caballeronia sp. LZ019]
MHVVAFLCCVASFACLALAMERHQTPLTRAHALSVRIAGWCGLALALVIIVAHEGWATGLVRYSGDTSLGAGVVYLALIAYERLRPR